MKRLIILLALIMMVIMVTPLLAEEYKSMCELHPEECAKSSLGKLGETLEQSDGNKYRVIAEAKSLTNPVWFQFVDSCPISEEFDGECNFVACFVLKEDGLYINVFSCLEATMMLMSYCKTEGVEYDDFIHKATVK